MKILGQGGKPRWIRKNARWEKEMEEMKFKHSHVQDHSRGFFWDHGHFEPPQRHVVPHFHEPN